LCINSDFIDSLNDYKNEKLNYSNIWNINRKAGVIGKNYIHPAVYPTKLIERIIELFTDYDSIVLDPFLGSGTNLIAAINLRRNSIGYEYNENFFSLIKYRITNEIKVDFDEEYFCSQMDKENKIFR
jgi:DNA modification methylase